MTVSSTTTRVSYSGNGVTTVFTVPFYFLTQNDLLVILRASNGVETTQTIGTNYTVSGAGVATGGSITMTSAPAAGTTVVILRNAAFTQGTDILPNDKLPAESLETALDKLTMLTQQLEEEVGRAVKFPASDSSALSAQLPASSVRAAKFLSFDSSGNPAVTTANPSPYTSADVTFIASGSNAVLRSVQSKLRDTVSVKDFGAVGDGVTDDTAAFQAAFNSASTSLFIPPGTYLINAPLTVTKALVLTGAGPGVSIVKRGAAYTTNLQLGIIGTGYPTSGSVSNLRFSNFTVDGNKADHSGQPWFNFQFGVGSGPFTVDNIVFENMEIKNAPWHGVALLDGVSNVLVDNCIFSSCGTLNAGNNNGTSIYAQSTQTLTLTESTFENHWEHGAYIDDCDNANVLNCTFRGNGLKNIEAYGLSFRASFGSVIGNRIYNTIKGAGLAVVRAAAPGLRNVVVSGNVIYNNSLNNSVREEVVFWNTANVVFSNNILGNSDGNNTPQFGINVFGPNSFCVFDGNIINGYDFGIRFNGEATDAKPNLNNITITNNQIYGYKVSSLYGVFIATNLEGDAFLVSNNLIKGIGNPFAVGVGCNQVSSNVSNFIAKDNTFINVTTNVFNASVGSPVYLEFYKQVVTASVAGATVNAGATNTVTVTVTGYTSPTYVTGTPAAPLPDGLVWTVSVPAGAQTATVQITNITGSPIAYSTGNWRFQVTRAIIA